LLRYKNSVQLVPDQFFRQRYKGYKYT
jgi:hypothetical protein